jgi:ribonucleoside-diphosphate reductase alpha chain
MEYPFAKSIRELRYSWEKENGEKESWEDIAVRNVTHVLSVVNVSKNTRDELINVISERKFIPGGRFLAQAGRPYHQTNNCYTLKAEDTRAGWGELLSKSTQALMSGGGIGIDYSDIRPNGAILKSSGGHSSGPIPLMKTVNEVGRGVMSGGKRRSAIWAGLRWSHPDIFEFIVAKNWIPEVRKLKEKDYDFPASLDMTNISVILDKEFFNAFDNSNHPLHKHAQDVYWQTITRMLKTGEPGFSIDYLNPNESLRNACTEIVSDRDSDVCCLGSINLPNIKDLTELKKVTELGSLFLLAGTEYSDVPYAKVKQVREEYRRIGMGLMGIHEWLLIHGYNYDSNPEFASWLQTWKDTSDRESKAWAYQFGFANPIAKRAIAPNGSTSIAGGMTTSGIEPIFSVAYQRRYLTPDGWKKQYVVDFVAEKLVEKGINPDEIEDANSLSLDVERRIKFQAFVQKYVDNSISSTINLPPFGSEGNDNVEVFGNTLYKYLPELRGITVYPDGSRGGQPLVPVDFNTAISKKGVVFEGNDECSGGVCGV